MKAFKARRPSSSMVVACAALIVALAGTAVAAPEAIKSVLNKGEKSQVKKIAKNQVNRLAPGLTVANALSANNAISANNAKAVASNTIASGQVIDRSLNAADVGVASGTFTYDSASVPANDCLFGGSEAAPGVTVGDHVLVTPPNAFVTDNLDLEAGVLNDGNIRINICNPTTGAINPPNLTFAFIVFHQ